MKLARYAGGGRIAIVDEPAPSCPAGGILVRTEASGLCSGELMDWYMERKVPHVLGHEVAGAVVESQDPRFPVGARVFVHHHAACLRCEWCKSGQHVQCEHWKRTRLEPGGMAECFAAARENLTDTLLVDDLRAIDAALIEPLGCVMKSLRITQSLNESGGSTAVIGLGVMGLMHLILLERATGYDLNDERVRHARELGLSAEHPRSFASADCVVVCPGSKAALDLAIDMVKPGGTILLFAPMPPGAETPVDLNRLYFSDVRIANSYSCGPEETRMAAEVLRAGGLRAEQVVSDFIGIEALPEAYQKMKRGEILKPMVIF